MRGKLAVLAGFLAALLAVSLGPGLPCLASVAPPPNGYIGLFADGNHSTCNVSYVPGSPPAVSTLWIWCLPSEKGVQSAEFKLVYPANVIPSANITLNPHISASTGDLTNGTSVVFDDCQMDWVWTHQQDFYIINNRCGVIKVDDRPGSNLGFYTCTPGDPKEPLTALNRLGINAYCGFGLATCGSFLSNVSVESYTVIRATFDDCVSLDGAPYASRFLLRAKSNPLDSIRIVQAVLEDDYTFTLTLENVMSDSATYVLSAESIYGCGDFPGWFNSKREFTFNKVVGTRLRTWAAVLCGSGVELTWELLEVDSDARLIVSRSEDGVVLHELDSGALENTGLRYTYVDSGAEPGKKYVYSVEYEVEGRRNQLFTTEPIAMPEARLALYQNRPNPFNPSTTISFSLLGECAVRLDVYDVSGRLVVRLIDGERRAPGLHNAEWNGRDASGRGSTSGVYIYRLTAGKETISRKMVLLRD